ncbi:hypothetical protein CRENPOLYSF1_1000004 [Crenothrix polyspora]|uniref:Uncharacterized protein n=1 Tax=Crenothrix polyspora TaxID=360316 RepID=A0A1R4GZ54_9GAMM|nr:hypothetical protein CRENPOLYSF1_1000004 [Crenothrix polyspora]
MFAFRTKQQYWGQPQLKIRLAIHLSVLTTLSVNPVTSAMVLISIPLPSIFNAIAFDAWYIPYSSPAE